MKSLTGYLDHAVNLERLAASEKNSKFKTELLNQAAVYRAMAIKRANELGLPPPSPQEISEETDPVDSQQRQQRSY
jgi:hypothetical protein